MTAIDFGAPVDVAGTCPRCQKGDRPIYARGAVRRCCACWAAAAAPRSVSFGPPARATEARRADAPCRFTVPYLVGSRAAGGLSVNSLYRPNGRGGKVLTDVAARFRDEVIVAVRGAQLVAPEGRLGMRVRFVPPDARPRDPDNLLKGLQDAVALAFGWPSDNRIAAVAVERMEPDPTNPRIEVELTAMAGGGLHGRTVR